MANNPPTKEVVSNLDGLWQATVKGCDPTCWYNGVWEITSNSDETIVVQERKGTCCGCIPNCIRKTHRMKKVADGKWEGRLGFKPISLKIVSENELEHLTTDGMMILTRC